MAFLSLTLNTIVYVGIARLILPFLSTVAVGVCAFRISSYSRGMNPDWMASGVYSICFRESGMGWDYEGVNHSGRRSVADGISWGDPSID